MMKIPIACLIACALISTMWSMDGPQPSLAEMGRAMMIGALTGTTEVVVDQPLIGIKNWLQLPKEAREKMPLSIKTVYRGLPANICGMAPTTAWQVAGNTMLTKLLPGDDMATKLARAGIAGMSSSVVATSIEMIILHQQMTGRSALEAIASINANAGLRTLCSRGLLLVAAREGLFTPGYLVVYPAIKDVIDKQLNNEGAAALAGGVLTGAVIAVATHPLDTIKTRLQADYTQKEIKGIKDAITSIYYEVDDRTGKPLKLKGFMKGVSARATRAMIAIPLMAKTYELLTQPESVIEDSQREISP